MMLRLNHWFNHARRRLGCPTGRCRAYLKHKVKNAVEYISNFEHAVAAEARRRGVDGVICGHIHKAEIRADRRHALLQRRRLGGELHGAGRTPRRPAGDHRLAGRAQALDAAGPSNLVPAE